MKKVVAAIMVLLFLYSPAAVFAANSFTLHLSGKAAERGGSITLSGTTAGPGDQVVVKIVSPAGTVFYIDVLKAVDGAYAQRLSIPASQLLAPSGSYNVVAGSGGAALTQEFTIQGEDNPGPGTPTAAPTATPSAVPTATPTPTPTPAPDSGTPSNPGTSQPVRTGSPASSAASPIPAGAGEASNARIKPELINGSYLIGADTLAQAMQQAAGQITIELPDTAGEAGVALELPQQSLNLLNAGNTGLVLTDGVRTISFPAGAMKTSDDNQTRLRIVLNASWNKEAQSLVGGSVRSDAAYASTGVLLSLVIQMVNGSNVTEIHQLAQPAEVSLRLTPAQITSMKTELAGIYYVDGNSAEYVPGTLTAGTVAFKATHFSAYALLVYDKNFADMTGHWAEAAVKSLAAKHLVNGVDAAHYEPARGITRAEFAALLMRAVERTGSAPANVASAPFVDVPSSAYYAKQAAEAATMGIMNGYEGAFRPSERITREEAAVALVNASKYFKLGAGVQAGKAYTDAREIASWAAASVAEAGASGLMQGDGTAFQPKKQVTRAEVAVMVGRLVQTGSSL
ncbi:S-layer homology domain-containing protein [Paenibacillus sp. FSL R10-2736]|uniref:S-layer homology domain-containing protein n=1 Tax=Paenibacillus sp. FSL R10-2736 TaxID=2954692 RepID=UPI0030F959F1